MLLMRRTQTSGERLVVYMEISYPEAGALAIITKADVDSTRQREDTSLNIRGLRCIIAQPID